MGAWGEGMQANDTALDYIAEFTNADGKLTTAFKKAIKSGKKTIDGELKSIDKHSDHDGWAVLGIADFFLDHGFKVSGSMTLLKKHLRAQRSEDTLGCWQDSAARKAALDRFEARASGKKVDAVDVEIDNLGLFARISLRTEGKTTEDLRKEIKKEKQ